MNSGAVARLDGNPKPHLPKLRVAGQGKGFSSALKDHYVLDSISRVPHSELRIVEVEMDLSISTVSRYGVRAVFDIAYHGDGQLTQIKDISNRQKISRRYLEQIFGKLLKAGLLKSRRGSQGGYVLSRDPSEITVLDIINATQGVIEPVSCLNEEKRTCEVFPVCVTWHVWKKTQNLLVDHFASVTVADLCALAHEHRLHKG